MKKKYQKPNVETFEIYAIEPLATSPGVSGNTGITTGEGEPPSSGNAKSGLFDNGSDEAGGIWDSWDD